MSLDNTRLLDFLGELDKELSRKIIVVAVGGTAMTLLKVKSSTIDVDFTIPGEYYDEFEAVLKIVPHGFTVHCFHDGAVFVNMLPGDYLKKSIQIKTKLKNIELRALHPVDIVVTKIGRLDDRDQQDIESCIKNFKLKKNEIVKRSGQLGYAANEANYRTNLQHVIKKFF
ncbi:MAG: DUF6036 family nucleotidyltransferase [Nitrosopumilaceae archaeon]